MSDKSMTPAASKLTRRSVVERILAARGNALAVSSLGNPTFDLAAAGDSALNFYLWGAMGGAVMVALGVAFAQSDRRVLAFVGDGEMLMGLGSLATVAVEKPKNLSIIVLDNQHYAETGMQPSHTGRGVDLSSVAAALEFPISRRVRTVTELDQLIPLLYSAAGPVFACIQVGIGPSPKVLPPRDGAYLRDRFREALLGRGAHV